MAAFLIRCDASAEIGLGHFMRCSTLALALRSRGHQVYFAMRRLTALAADLLGNHGFPLLQLPSDTATLEEEIPRLKAWKIALAIKAILIDHYGATPSFFASLAEPGILLAAINDMAD